MDFEDTGITVHPTIPWLGASLDGYGKMLFEGKCPGHKVHEDLGGYGIQVQVQMECADVDSNLFSSLWPHGDGAELTVQLVQRDKAMFRDYIYPLLDETLNAAEKGTSLVGLTQLISP